MNYPCLMDGQLTSSEVRNKGNHKSVYTIQFFMIYTNICYIRNHELELLENVKEAITYHRNQIPENPTVLMLEPPKLTGAARAP